MKILFLSYYSKNLERGAEVFVKELSLRLGKKHEVEVLSGGARRPLARWPILWRFFVDPAGLAVLWFTLKNLPTVFKGKFDVVVPINGGWQPALMRFVTWLSGAKVVISGHSGKGWDDRNNLWSFPDAFVALSSFLSSWAKRANPFVRVEYIPNGVDVETFKPQGQKINPRSEGPIILCVGALTDEKRIELAIRAVAKLKGGSLLIAGDGPQKDRLEKMGRELLGDKFLITQFPYSKMPQVYRSADLFTLPSPWFRSFEIVLLEAMASNLPVVANNDPIRKEIVGPAGLLVDPEDSKEYAKALEKALSRNWGDKPRRQAEKFSWNKIAREYEKLFESLVK